METSNKESKYPKFCINLHFSNGWATNTVLELDEGILPSQAVIVDYDSLPMRCKVCLSWSHKVKYCGTFMRRRKPSHISNRGLHAQTTKHIGKKKNNNIDQEVFNK